MKSYKQKPGEFEIRILPDGRVLIPAPDGAMLKIAKALDTKRKKSPSAKGARKNERGNGRA